MAEKVDIAVEGMTCAACSSRVERALGKLDFIAAANVNLATERATVTLDTPKHIDDVLEAIRKAGYGASLVAGDKTREAQDAAREQEFSRLKHSVLIAAAATIPLFILEMGHMLIPAFATWLDSFLTMQARFFVMFVLATIVQFGPGWRFYERGAVALWQRSPDMDSLVMLGSSAAYGYSVVATFLPNVIPDGGGHVYFESSAVIITLILLGRLFEMQARGRTSSAIRELVKLRPRTAVVLQDGAEVTVPIDDVQVGDVLLLKPGERVAVDGVVVSGESFVSEAMMSGEPVPVEKSAGDQVIGGTVNGSGALTYRAEAVGSHTVLAQIIELVEEAQGAKLPIQALADRVVRVFVPIVIGIAALTFIAWLIFGPEPAATFALVNTVAVLIIACPCAMGLATPTSIMVGSAKAAELGVLFRNGGALQSLGEVSVMAFDKTGTLTEGKPTVGTVQAFGMSERELIALTAAAEQQSEHPLALAVLAYAAEHNVAPAEVESFQAESGFGIRAQVAGQDVVVGSERYLHRFDIDTAQGREVEAAVGSELWVGIDGQLAGLITVTDQVKDEARTVVKALIERGIEPVMITGDAKRNAAHVAEELGITRVLAEVAPADKAAAVTELQQGGSVAFVGDGMNDAPALAQADVGVAIGTGTDVAIETADLVLMSGRLHNVVNAVQLSRATLSNIKQNLFWAFIYNIVLIPVAAGVLYPAFGIQLSPMLAAAAMGLSSVFVVFNALRLRTFASPL